MESRLWPWSLLLRCRMAIYNIGKNNGTILVSAVANLKAILKKQFSKPTFVDPSQQPHLNNIRNQAMNLK